MLWLTKRRRVQNLVPRPKLQVIRGFRCYHWFSDREFLVREYIQNEKSANQIAKEIGCSHSTLLKHLAKFGIPIRKTTPAGRRGQLGYGARLVRGKEVQNSREIDTITRMESLHRLGYSYGRISQILNSMKVPTKTRKAKWHPTTVMKILKAREAVNDALQLSRPSETETASTLCNGVESSIG